MRIGIDASSMAVPQKTGVARYVLRLVERLEKLDDENEYVIYYRLSRWKRRKYFYRPTKATTRVKLFQEPFFAGRGIDVFHGPDARLPKIRGPRACAPKLVATVHDLFSLVSEEFADDKFRKKKIARYKDIAERADRIVCDSESTRRDFTRFFPEAESKTCVIYPGVDDRFSPRGEAEIEGVRRKYGIGPEYILYVGSLSKRKNILRMFEAFREVRRQRGGDIQFVAAGRLTHGKEEILSYLKDNRCDGRILLPGYVPDEDLPALYSGARLFL
ncbi:MAG: glycosyltransferase family 4 protein, partial [Candidatus Abyssubacteria bacterium]|nr:glycosyltransferase family 4 protein [Candidatus Abyssubacteria bacterium]